VVEQVGVVQQRPKLRDVCLTQDLPRSVYPLLTNADERAKQSTWLKCGGVGNARKRLEDGAQGSGDLSFYSWISGLQISGHEFVAPIMLRDAVLTDIPSGECRARCRANELSDDMKS
jgi:hypothetical protein